MRIQTCFPFFETSADLGKVLCEKLFRIFLEYSITNCFKFSSVELGKLDNILIINSNNSIRRKIHTSLYNLCKNPNIIGNRVKCFP